MRSVKLLSAAIDNDARSAPAYALRALIHARAGQVREAFADAEIVTQLGRPLWIGSARRVVDRDTDHAVTRTPTRTG